MRVDKFLKVSRIIKRRTVAKDVCDGGKVKINGKVVKAGGNVAIGDIIEIQFGEKLFKAKVKDIRETVPAKEADTLYEVL